MIKSAHRGIQQVGKKFLVFEYNYKTRKSVLVGTRNTLEEALEYQRKRNLETNKIFLLKEDGVLSPYFKDEFCYGIVDGQVVPAIAKIDVEVGNDFFPLALYTLSAEGVRYIPYSDRLYESRELAQGFLGSSS